MIIINQWRNDDVDYHQDPIKIKNEENKYNLFISNKLMASSDDKEIINKLYKRLIHFIEKYKRNTDTFDISKELEFINNNSNAFGSYYS